MWVPRTVSAILKYPIEGKAGWNCPLQQHHMVLSAKGRTHTLVRPLRGLRGTSNSRTVRPSRYPPMASAASAASKLPGMAPRPKKSEKRLLGPLPPGHGSKAKIRNRSEHPIQSPTQIGSKMGGEFTYPKMVTLVLTHCHLRQTPGRSRTAFSLPCESG